METAMRTRVSDLFLESVPGINIPGGYGLCMKLRSGVAGHGAVWKTHFA